MKNILGYLVIESVQDFDDNVQREDNGSILLRNVNGMIYHNGNKADFPQYYKYIKSYDAHFMGDYVPCDLSEIIARIDEQINHYNGIKNSLIN